ncbi:MAG: hypothetical protein HY705_09705 [Gemmatimonadetes bacterium]|nr:hypothetical protein [Gemmatimonadota bacterium]
MRSLNSTDWAILEFLTREPRPIAPLLATLSKGTVYRRLGVLRAAGLAAKRGAHYSLTSAGERAKAERDAESLTDGLATIYPPLSTVPTPQHRAVVELALAASVHRRHGDADDHHAGFVLLGPTMAWKTSAGHFLCLALGVDPATHIVDLSAESGKSVWLRRGPSGEIVAQRVILDSPLVVFDEYQFADRAVRRAIAPFLSGRRRVPVENTVLTIAPVPVITMNPAPGETLIARTGLSTPQLRRLIPCDLGALDLPDLALEGGRAVEAARQAGPLPQREPRGSCKNLRPAVVRLLRQALRPEALGLVDIELLLGLGRGLTAWLPPAVAMRQALYDVLLVVETVGWTEPGWVDLVRTCSLVPGEDTGREPPDSVALARVSRAAGEPRLRLFPEDDERPGLKEGSAMSSGDSIMPTFTLSESSKATLVWLAQEAHMPLDDVVWLLANHYQFTQANDTDLFDLNVIVRLREECEEKDVAVADLRRFLDGLRVLRKHDLTLDDVGAALEVVDALAAAGLTLESASEVAELMEALAEAGVEDATIPDQLRDALARFEALGYAPDRLAKLAEVQTKLEALALTPERLDEALVQLQEVQALGLDPATARRLAEAIHAAAAEGADRRQLVTRLVETAAADLKLGTLRTEQARLQQAINDLRAKQAKLRERVEDLRAQAARGQEQEEALSRRVEELRKEAEALPDVLGAGLAVQDALLAADLTDRFWVSVLRLHEMKTKHPGQFPASEKMLTATIRQMVRDLLVRIAATEPAPVATASSG